MNIINLLRISRGLLKARVKTRFYILLLLSIFLQSVFSHTHAQSVTVINTTNITITESVVDGLSAFGNAVDGSFGIISDYTPVLDVLGLMIQSKNKEDSFKESAPQLFGELNQISSNIQALHTSLSSLEETVTALALNGPLLRVSEEAYTLEKQTLGLLGDALKTQCRAVPAARMININNRLEELTNTVDFAADYAGDEARRIVVSHTLAQISMKMELTRARCGELFTDSENEYIRTVLGRVREELLSRTMNYVAGYPYVTPNVRKEARAIVAKEIRHLESNDSDALVDCAKRSYKYEEDDFPEARGVADCRKITVGFSTKRRWFSDKYKCTITEYSGYRLPMMSHTEGKFRTPNAPITVNRSGEPLSAKERQSCVVVDDSVIRLDSKYRNDANKKYRSLSQAAKVLIDAQVSEQANRFGLLTIELLSEIEKRIQT